MEFGFDDEQVALRDTVRRFCAGRLDPAAIAGREGAPAAAEVWAGLADLGVLGMLAPGSGTGAVEAAIAFEELGAHLATGPVLWSALAAPFVPGAASGLVRVAGVALDRDPAVPGPDGRGGGPVVVEHGEECDVLVVLGPDRLTALPRAELDLTGGGPAFDPLTPTAVLTSLPEGEVVGDAAAAAQVRLAGTILAAALLVGAAARALDVAAGYARERHQFGVPIGSFQAVKHLLADMYVRLEMARTATYAAAALADDPRAGDPCRAAASAKLLAGDAGIDNARAAVQVLGGMGFTWDMLPHYLLKRAWVLEHQFGTRSEHAARLAGAVEADVVAA